MITWALIYVTLPFAMSIFLDPPFPGARKIMTLFPPPPPPSPPLLISDKSLGHAKTKNIDYNLLQMCDTAPIEYNTNDMKVVWKALLTETGEFLERNSFPRSGLAYRRGTSRS